MAPHWLGPLLLALPALFLAAAEQQVLGTWHLVDITKVVCTEEPVEVAIALQDYQTAEARDLPHIVTFYRTSSKPVSVTFQVEDSSGDAVVDEMTVPLLSLNSGSGTISARSWMGSGPGSLEQPDATADASTLAVMVAAHPTSATDLDAAGGDKQAAWHQAPTGAGDTDPAGEEEVLDPLDLEYVEQEEGADEAPLLESPPPASLTARQENANAKLKAWLDAVDAAVEELHLQGAVDEEAERSLLSQRQGWPDGPSAPRRQLAGKGGSGRGVSWGNSRRSSGPRSGFDNRRYGNPGNPRAGAYGFTDNARFNRLYPNGFRSTSYGYAGYRAYGAGTSVRMSAAASYRVYFLGGWYGSRYSTYGYHRRRSNRTRTNGVALRVDASDADDSGRVCWFCDGDCAAEGSTVRETCQECYDLWKDAAQQKCFTTFAPFEDANRDDIMSTGFLPGDLEGPLKVRISRVYGYAKEELCPPAGWTVQEMETGGWVPPEVDIFVTITQVDMLDNGGLPAWGIVLIVLAATIFLIAAGLAIYAWHVKAKSRESLREFSWREPTVQLTDIGPGQVASDVPRGPSEAGPSDVQPTSSPRR